MSANGVKSIKYNLIQGGLALGCRVKGGKILPALSGGEVNTTCPNSIKFAAYAHYSNSIIAMNAVSMYVSAGFGDFKLSAIAEARLPFYMEYKQDNKPKCAVVFNTQFANFTDTGIIIEFAKRDICGGVYKNGRVFGIDVNDSYKLWWSGVNGIKDWEEKIDGAGWLYTEVELGEIYNLVLFKDGLAVIKKFGITLLDIGGAPEDFKELVTVSTPVIYQKCSVVCGSKLYFYTVDGLYAFNGTVAEKVETEGASEFTSAVYATTYGSCVFFAGTHKGLGRGVILVYDTEDKTSYFIDVAATALLAGDGMYAFKKGGAVKLGKGLQYTYQSEEFGRFSKRKKTLESIFIDCEEEVDITVFTERGSRLFKGVKGKIPTHARGSYFKVSVDGKNAEIKELSATVEYY